MLYNKRPLIYIPKKKKVVSGGTPTPPTPPEALGAVWVKSQYLNYSVTMDAFYPARICFSPTRLAYRGNTFPVGTKDTWSFTTGLSNAVTIVPIRGNAAMDFVSRASAMRWAPVDVILFTASGVNWDLPYLFFIPSSSGGDYNVYKFKDSTKQNPYIFEQRMIDEAISGTSSPTFYLNKLDRMNDIQRVYTKLGNEGITQNGCLVATDKDFTFWTNQSLIAYSNVFMQENYGRKTAVVEIDLGV